MESRDECLPEETKKGSNMPACVIQITLDNATAEELGAICDGIENAVEYILDSYPEVQCSFGAVYPGGSEKDPDFDWAEIEKVVANSKSDDWTEF